MDLNVMLECLDNMREEIEAYLDASRTAKDGKERPIVGRVCAETHCLTLASALMHLDGVRNHLRAAMGMELR